MDPMALLTLVPLAGLGAESLALSRARNRVPVRIHVNGTRGKSTTVRLVAAMCRAHGWRTVAKYTGGKPGYIDTAGIEHDWPRLGHARLGEQQRFWRKAAANCAEAAVLECMAVDPYLQWVAEQRITKATHTVITNIRPDHFEVMGRSLPEIAGSLANTVPSGGQLILGDPAFAELFAQAAAARHTALQVVTEADRSALWEVAGRSCGWSPAMLENAATALCVAKTLGIPDHIALDILRGWPQPAPLYPALWSGEKVQVINALSANDAVSAAAAWNELPPGTKGVALYAHRGDRPLRLQSFLEALAQEKRCQEILIAGPIASQHVFLRRWRRRVSVPSGEPVGKPPVISAVGTGRCADRLAQLAHTATEPIWLVLLGNELGMPARLQSLTQPVGGVESVSGMQPGGQADNAAGSDARTLEREAR